MESAIVVEKKRRGPRRTKILDNNKLITHSKDNLETMNESNISSNIILDEVIETTSENIVIKSTNIINDDNLKIPKKRGRKPKGGKIVSQNNENSDSNIQTIPNIILHLKCKMSDLEQYNSLLLSNQEANPINLNIKNHNFFINNNQLNSNNITESENELNEIQGLDTYEQFGKTTKTSELGYLIIDAPNKLPQDEFVYGLKNTCNCEKNNIISNNDMNSIWKKLKDLEVQLHKNDISDKRSACFWDTCEFDTPPVYIPRVQLDNSYHVYGCFCSPECAVAYLLKENIDAATRFERLHLLNHMYGKICNYERSIKPAPDPYYTLDKYYGNLSIQEFRKLLKSERLLLVVDLPLTRELPEIHLDNGDYLIGGQSIPTTGKYKVKKVSQKTTKANIMQERFGNSLSK